MEKKPLQFMGMRKAPQRIFMIESTPIIRDGRKVVIKNGSIIQSDTLDYLANSLLAAGKAVAYRAGMEHGFRPR